MARLRTELRDPRSAGESARRLAWRESADLARGRVVLMRGGQADVARRLVELARRDLSERFSSVEPRLRHDGPLLGPAEHGDLRRIRSLVADILADHHA